MATTAGYVLILSLTLIFSLIATWISNKELARWGVVELGDIGRNLIVAAVMTGIAFRYFFLQHQLRRQEQAELNSRIQALQSRIRPHFLFNSMNIIASLISIDPETAEEVVEDLSMLFRASLNDSTDKPVLLSEELSWKMPSTMASSPYRTVEQSWCEFAKRLTASLHLSPTLLLH